MDVTLVAVLVTILADILMKWKKSRAEDRATGEMKNVVIELKEMHKVNTLAIAAVNRRVDQVEARLAFVEAPRWSGQAAH